MYCRNCGNEVSDQAIMCVACGTPPKAGNKYCYHCKAETAPGAVVCLGCGVPLGGGVSGPRPESKRVVAAILALLLGAFGIHKFYLGYTAAGVIQLVIALIVAPLITIFSCGLGLPLAIAAVSIIPFVEGIIYLTKSDDQFIDTYQLKQKQWF